DMAQSVERILGKDEVPSSILGISTIKEKASLKREAFLHPPRSKKFPNIPYCQYFPLFLACIVFLLI
ncbi:hypothetical protein, partial [Aeromonas sp. 600479]|uniref:hypothetical protein n=1 Tax=Aeromonas sp. 600479 TaxID=2712028 RepID=UPI003B9FC5C5